MAKFFKNISSFLFDEIHENANHQVSGKINLLDSKKTFLHFDIKFIFDKFYFKVRTIDCVNHDMQAF